MYENIRMEPSTIYNSYLLTQIFSSNIQDNLKEMRDHKLLSIFKTFQGRGGVKMIKIRNILA